MPSGDDGSCSPMTPKVLRCIITQGGAMWMGADFVLGRGGVHISTVPHNAPFCFLLYKQMGNIYS